MEKNLQVLEVIEELDIEKLKTLFTSGVITIEEYRNALEIINIEIEKKSDFIPFEEWLTPKEYAKMYKRAMRYYRTLFWFGLIDFIPLAYIFLFPIYWPLVIYTWIIAFGKELVVPTDEIVKQNHYLVIAIILSWVPFVTFVADIFIIFKSASLRREIKKNIKEYEIEYNIELEKNKQ